MKSISAAIVILAGAVLLASSTTLVSHSDTQNLIQTVGELVLAAGLVGWVWPPFRRMVAWLWPAFQHRWRAAIFFGLVLGCSTAAAIWYVIPARYTAFSEMIVQPNRTFIYDNRTAGTPVVDLETYKETLIRQAKFPYVLNATLRDEKVARCQTLRSQIDPEDWLSKHIKITSPSEEFLRISLEGVNPKDLELIVNAFTTAFTKEVLDADRKSEEDKLDKQRQLLRSEQASLDAKRNDLQRIDKQVASNSEHAKTKFKKNSDLVVAFERQLADMDMKLMDYELRQQFLRDERVRKAANEADGNKQDQKDERKELASNIKIKDGTVQAAMLEEQEYQELLQDVQDARRVFSAMETRFPSGDPKVDEKKQQLAAAQAAIDKYEAEHMEIVRERLVHEILQHQEEMRTAALANPSVGMSADAINSEEEIQKQINLLIARKRLYRDRLNNLETEDRELTVQWVDRERLHEQVVEIQGRVDFYAQRIRAAEIEFHNTPKPVELKRPALVPRVTDNSRRLTLASLAGLGTFLLVCLSVLGMCRNPWDATAYINRGNMCYEKGHLDDALEDFTKAIRLDPKNAIAYTNRGTVWQIKGELDGALEDFTEAIRLDPLNASAFNGRAWLLATAPYEENRDGPQAVADATRACELTDWSSANMLNTLAAAYAEMGDFEQAVTWQTKAQELASESDKAKWSFLLDLYHSGKPYRQEPE